MAMALRLRPQYRQGLRQGSQPRQCAVLRPRSALRTRNNGSFDGLPGLATGFALVPVFAPNAALAAPEVAGSLQIVLVAFLAASMAILAAVSVKRRQEQSEEDLLKGRAWDLHRAVVETKSERPSSELEFATAGAAIASMGTVRAPETSVAVPTRATVQSPPAQQELAPSRGLSPPEVRPASPDDASAEVTVSGAVAWEPSLPKGTAADDAHSRVAQACESPAQAEQHHAADDSSARKAEARAWTAHWRARTATLPVEDKPGADTAAAPPVATDDSSVRKAEARAWIAHWRARTATLSVKDKPGTDSAAAQMVAADDSSERKVQTRAWIARWRARAATQSAPLPPVPVGTPVARKAPVAAAAAAMPGAAAVPVMPAAAAAPAAKAPHALDTPSAGQARLLTGQRAAQTGVPKQPSNVFVQLWRAFVAALQRIWAFLQSLFSKAGKK